MYIFIYTLDTWLWRRIMRFVVDFCVMLCVCHVTYLANTGEGVEGICAGRALTQRPEILMSLCQAYSIGPLAHSLGIF